MQIDFKVVLQYVSEPLRWLVIAFLAYAIDYIVPQMKPEYIPYTMIFFRGLDKWLHDLGKQVDSDALAKGIVRF